MLATGKDAATIVGEQGLGQISDAALLEDLARQTLAANPRAVEDFRQGKSQALKFLVGQVMRGSKGQANPRTAEAVLQRQLAP